MSVERYTLDANILFYAIDAQSGSKNELAYRLVQAATRNAECVLSLQTLGETYYAIIRKRPLLAQGARELLRQMQRFVQMVSVTPDDFLEALRMHESRPVQFWDMLLLATVRSKWLHNDSYRRPAG